MTGTAETEAAEFHQIYKLDVTVIPTNRPCIRKDDNDSIFKTKREKFNAILDDVAERHAKGQPVLLGTISVDDSEILSRMLKIRNIPHNVLNAKNHAREAEIVARAGEIGAVTVATNMAGRGTDIKLQKGVAELGGLHVIGSSRHDSRRIDRQLRGRCSRQGDPGSSKFYVSLEDNLMRLFGSDRIVKIFDRFGLEEGDELQHPWLNKSIETAQKRVEQHHFSIRKRTLDFDDVMNKQREIVYQLRRDALLSEAPHDVLFGIIEQAVQNEIMASGISSRSEKSGEFDFDHFLGYLNVTFPLNFTREELTEGIADGRLVDADKLTLQVVERIEQAYANRNTGMTQEQVDYLERHTVLEAIDRLWQEHLYAMDGLRSSIYLRVYAAQKDPLVEYKHEAYNLFKRLMDQVYHDVAHNLFRMTLTRIESIEEMLANMPQEQVHQLLEQFGGRLPEEEAARQMMEEEPEEPVEVPGITFYREAPKVGRNDLCPCGSGKKFKKCCGK
ncbi:MAG: SEC-C domain-containing protein [Lentisphaeria bacterium]|nr:SEC-C domain-containing protein [Lentisphaeria bacterium]